MLLIFVCRLVGWKRDEAMRPSVRFGVHLQGLLCIEHTYGRVGEESQGSPSSNAQSWKAPAAESRRGVCPVSLLPRSLMPAPGAAGRRSRPVTAAYKDYFSQAALSQYVHLFSLTGRNAEDFHVKTKQQTLPH